MSATILILPTVKREAFDTTQSLVVTLSEGSFKRLKGYATDWNLSEQECASMLLTEAIIKRGKT